MVAICAIFKNEALYLREWIEFHKRQGVEAFYLYNNESTDDWESITKNYPEVYPRNWPYEKPCQLGAYQDCINALKGTDQWVAFIDVDEFLFSPSGHTLAEETEFLKPRAYGINWRCFGSGGQDYYGEEPVTRRFLFRASTSNPCNLHIKSLVHMDQEVKVGGDPHFFKVEHGTFDEQGRELVGPFTQSHSSNWFRIHHYASKSREEWMKRKSLGTPDRKEIETPEWVWGMDRAGIFDDSILKI